MIELPSLLFPLEICFIQGNTRFAKLALCSATNAHRFIYAFYIVHSRNLKPGCHWSWNLGTNELSFRLLEKKMRRY